MAQLQLKKTVVNTVVHTLTVETSNTVNGTSLHQ